MKKIQLAVLYVFLILAALSVLIGATLAVMNATAWAFNKTPLGPVESGSGEIIVFAVAIVSLVAIGLYITARRWWNEQPKGNFPISDARNVRRHFEESLHSPMARPTPN